MPIIRFLGRYRPAYHFIQTHLRLQIVRRITIIKDPHINNINDKIVWRWPQSGYIVYFGCFCCDVVCKNVEDFFSNQAKCCSKHIFIICSMMMLANGLLLGQKISTIHSYRRLYAAIQIMDGNTVSTIRNSESACSFKFRRVPGRPT